MHTHLLNDTSFLFLDIYSRKVKKNVAIRRLSWWLRWGRVCLQCRRTRFRFLGQEDPLEKEVVTHSSILAWDIPRTKEAVRLQSMGSQRNQS